MRILDRSYARTWLLPTLASLLICLTLFMVVDILEIADEMAQHSPVLSDVVLYLTYRALYFLYFLAPLATLIGGFWGFCSAKDSNEWTAALSSGRHPLNLLRAPLLLLGLITLLMTAYGVFLLPDITSRASFMRDFSLKDKSPPTPVYHNLHLLLPDGRSLDVREFDPTTRTLREIVVTEKTETRVLERRYASRARYTSPAGWVMEEVRTFRFEATGELSYQDRSDSEVLPLESPEVLLDVLSVNPRRTDVDPAQLSLEDLSTAIAFRVRRGMNAAPERVMFHWKFGFSSSFLVLGVIGILIGTRAGLNRAAGIGFCLIFAFAYWLVFSTATSLGKSVVLPGRWSVVSPLLFVYGPPLLFLAASAFYWLSPRTRS